MRAAEETLRNATGRDLVVLARVARAFPAGLPAAILPYTLAPDLLIGWPHALCPEECAFLMLEVAARPEIGRINTANLELVMALAPDFIFNGGSNSETDVSLARSVEA